MERTTGFPTAILAAMQAGLYGARVAAGAFVPFQVVPPMLLMDELRRAGVTGFTMTEG